MSLRIDHTYGRIGVEVQNSKLEIKNIQAKLERQQTHVQVEIKSDLPRVWIDQHECWATAGLKNNAEILQEAAANAHQQALAYTAQKAQEGDMLANTPYNKGAIASIARSNSYHENIYDIDLIPKARPSIEVTGGVNINFREAQINTDFIEGKAEISATNPYIRFYEEQKANLEISYIGENIDVMV